MIDSYVKQINDLLKKIQEEDNENMETIISYATSTEVNVGGRLCRYGELYKLVLDSESLDEILQQLEYLFKLAKFECYTDEVKELQELTIKFIKEGYSFLVGREKLLTIIKEEYLLKTIINCL